MYKKSGYTLIIIGIVLLCVALSIFLYNEAISLRAEDASARAVSAIKEEIIHNLQNGTIEREEHVQEETEDVVEEHVYQEMSSITIDGTDYVGYISVPSVDIELPVIAEWNYDNLKLAPCRYTGSIHEDDLVICGHNYRSQFNPLQDVEIGSVVTFVDVFGNLTTYEILEIEVINPTDISLMTESEYPLTLFTCTYGGQARRAIRCIEVETE